MRFRSPLAVVSVAALTMLLATACSKPADSPAAEVGSAPSNTIANPPAGGSVSMSPEVVDEAVRKVLQNFLKALSDGDYTAAADYWSPASSAMPPRREHYQGVSDWHFISSEMIEATSNGAYVQLNFTVKVEGDAAEGLSDGRNTWFVRLSSATGKWGIMSLSTNG